MLWSLWSRDSKIDCISKKKNQKNKKKSRWNELIFTCWGKFRKTFSFWGGHGEKWTWPLNLWDHKICCILSMSLWIELFFAGWLWCNNFWLDRHWTLLTFNASLLQLYLWDPRQKLEGSYKMRSVCPSILPRFLGIGSLDFSEFLHDATNHYEVERDRAGIFLKLFYSPKIEEIGRNRFFWIWRQIWSLIFTEFVV